MSRDPYESFDDDFEEGTRPGRRQGIDLTGMRVRVVATVFVIALGVLIIALAVRPRGEGNTTEVLPPEPTAVVTDESNETVSEPLATFTPGATSTPPPLDEPTPDASVITDTVPGPTGALTVGAPATVSGTGGSGVNMRNGSGTSFDIIRILGDDTVISLVEGPTDADGFTWWKARLDDGTEGWVVQDYLIP